MEGGLPDTHPVDGPIVLLNVAEPRSDALIVTAGGVQVVPLPQVTPAAVAEQAADLHLALALLDHPRLLDGLSPRKHRAMANEGVRDVLTWLWRHVAAPVLERLELTAGGPPKRVWWSPGGLMSRLPVHAAGHLDPKTGTFRCVADHIVSSYTPTIAALRHARRDVPAGVPSRLLVVAVPEVIGSAELPGVRQEATALAETYHADLLIGPDAAPAAVSAKLREYDCVHFACHGASDWHPSENRLVLYDDGSAPLTVAGIARLRLPGARLAYLAACSTTETRPDLADEAIHVTASFLLAGYATVIGTLWPIVDQVAAEVTVDVYAAMADWNGGIYPSRGALALHTAVAELRRRFPAHPALWAAYLHMGA